VDQAETCSDVRYLFDYQDDLIELPTEGDDVGDEWDQFVR